MTILYLARKYPDSDEFFRNSLIFSRYRSTVDSFTPTMKKFFKIVSFLHVLNIDFDFCCLSGGIESVACTV